MNEEIEEMMLTVPQKIVAYDGKHAVQHLYREQRQEIAEALYNAGYRKVRSDAKGNLLKIQNLCIEFDEMGYEPTTLCENPEQTAKKWKSDLMYEIGLFLDEAMGIKARYNELKAENERLTERLGQILLSIDTVKEMNAMCNIDEQRKQAVKDFAEKIKAKLNDIFGKTICSDLDTEDITDIIDELLKEDENGKNKS